MESFTQGDKNHEQDQSTRCKIMVDEEMAGHTESYHNEYTGKEVDKLGWKGLQIPNGQLCNVCGTELVDKCPRCGAPVCCPKCCQETAEANEMNRQYKENPKAFG